MCVLVVQTTDLVSVHGCGKMTRRPRLDLSFEWVRSFGKQSSQKIGRAGGSLGIVIFAPSTLASLQQGCKDVC